MITGIDLWFFGLGSKMCLIIRWCRVRLTGGPPNLVEKSRGYEEIRNPLFLGVQGFWSISGPSSHTSHSYFTSSISFPKLSTTSYRTFSGANFLLISSKNLRAHRILVFSISFRTIEDMEPLVSATKYTCLIVPSLNEIAQSGL